MSKDLRIISASDLFRKNIPELKYNIQHLVVPGLTILAAAPKVGKSYLICYLGYCMATGQKAFAKLSTRKSKVLFLALEDNERRLQARLAEIANASLLGAVNIPENLHLVTSLGENKDSIQVIKRLINKEGYEVVIIDILQRIAKPEETGSYKKEYTLVKRLKELVEIIQNSLTQSGVFEFQEEESTDYARDIFSAACIVNYLENDVPVAKLAFAKASTRKGLYLANIVPKPGNSISMEKYNKIGLLFIREFKAFYTYQDKRVTFTSTGEAITLANIIPGGKTRTFFQRYLNAHPVSYHPLDIERLDVFICALSRFRSSINLALLNRYLREELKWNKKDSNWCTKRIDTGLCVLEVNRKF